MKITMLTLQAGPSGVRKPGITYSVPDAEAQELIKGGYAVKAETAAAPRAATKSQGRKATKLEAVDPSTGETPEEEDAAEPEEGATT